MAKELSTEELLKLPDDEILKYIRKMRPAELLRKRSKNIPTPREYKAGGGKVYKYKKGTSDKTIIGKNKGMRGSEKPSSLGADKTKGIDPKFSSRVKKQNEQGMKEAANILKQASDQKLNSPPPKNKGLKKLPKNVRNKMGFKKHGGKITYRMSGGQVVAGSYE